MYELSGFQENFNILNCVNSTENWIHYMYGLFRFTENMNYVDVLNVRICINSKQNCAHYMYGLSEYAENLNSKNYVNSTINCVH